MTDTQTPALTAEMVEHDLADALARFDELKDRQELADTPGTAGLLFRTCRLALHLHARVKELEVDVERHRTAKHRASVAGSDEYFAAERCFCGWIGDDQVRECNEHKDRRLASEAQVERQKEIIKTCLTVLCMGRSALEQPTAAVLRDFEIAIEGCRSALTGGTDAR